MSCAALQAFPYSRNREKEEKEERQREREGERITAGS